MNQLTKIIALGLFIASTTRVNAQTNDSPAGAYQWKKGKTELQSGYVVLKSGKRMDGKISLIGSASQVTEVAYEGDGKDIKFPAASLKAYGLDAVTLMRALQSQEGPSTKARKACMNGEVWVL